MADLPGANPAKKNKDADQIARLIEQLGEDAFETREAAARTLEKLGEKALPALIEAAAKSKDLETRRRAWRLVRKIMPRKFKSKTLGMELVRVGAGEFKMGSPLAEPGRRGDEGLHGIKVNKPFYMGTYEVTQDEYQKVMKTNPSWFSAKGGGSGKVTGLATGQFPVENVTWYDAVEFCNRLSKQDGLKQHYELTNVKKKNDSIISATVKTVGGNGYRLPTEAEWEYACRAGTSTAFNFGGVTRRGDLNAKPIAVAGGYGSYYKWPDLGRTTKVGSHKANVLGLHDMHGNVAEWCQDWYDKDYYTKSPKEDPTGPTTGKHRVLRGGSWLVTETSCRSASRAFHAPDEAKYYSGFRVVRNP